MSQPVSIFGPENTPFEAIGGETEVRRLVDAFYDRVEHDPVLHAMHDDDLTEVRQKLHEFLVGWLGGPPLYIQKHGHPRLRGRHMPFPIDQEAVDAWMQCMEGAMDDVGIRGDLRAFLSQRFAHTANFMRNR